MSEEQTPPAGNGGDVPSPGPGDELKPEPKKRRRLWPFFVVGFVLLLLLVVLFLPAILSMAWARSMVVSQVNNSLNGQVQINDWSLSWARGIEIRGLRIFQEGAQILELNRLSTDLSVASLVRGNYHLGKTTIEGLDFVLKRYADGTTNFQRLVKEPSTEPLKLPDMRGDVQADFRGTFEQEGAQPVLIDRSTLKAQISEINQPIEHQVDLTLRVGAGPAGKLLAEGTIKPFEKNEVNLEHLAANEKITIQSLDLASLAPFLGTLPVNQVQGQANGKLTAKMAGTSEIQVAGQITGRDVAATGPALRGDTYRTSQLTIDIPTSVVSQATGRIRTGDGQANQPVVVKVDQGQVTITADSSLSAITNLLQNQKPGSDGQMQVSAEVDLAKVAGQLPNAMRLQQGMKPVSGQLRQVTSVALSPEKAALKHQMDLTDLAATNAQGQRVTAQPIHVNFEASSLGGGGAVPDLRDLVLLWQSGFATVNGKGQSLSQLTVDGQVNLAALRQEVGQFVDLGQRQMAGEAQFRVATQGDLMREEGTAQVEASLVAANLQVTGWTDAPVNQPRIELAAKGDLARGKEQWVQAFRNAVLTLRSGNPQQPTTDIEAAGDIVLQARGADSKNANVQITAPSFAVNRFNVNLPAAQREFGPLLQPLRDRGLDLTQGTLSLQSSGSYDGTQATVKVFKLATADVTVQRKAQDGRVVPVLQRYSGTVDAVGLVWQDEKGLQAQVSRLLWNDTGGLVSIEEVGEGDLIVQVPRSGGFMANGKLRVGADLKAMNDMLQAMGDRPADAAAGGREAGQLRRGRLAGDIQFVRAEQPETRISGDLTVSDLWVTTHDQPIRNEKVTLALRGVAADDLSTIAAQQLDVKSSFMNLAVSDAVLRLPRKQDEAGTAAVPVDALQKADLAFDVPDLGRATALVDVLMPPQVVEGAKDEARGRGDARRATDDAAAVKQESLPPVAVRSGSLRGAVRVARTDQGMAVNVSELTGNRIIIDRGKGTFGPRSVALRVAALVVPDVQKAQAGLVQQIRELRITELTGNTGLADIVLQEPIVVRNPAGPMQVTGAVKLTGEVQLLMNLLEALQGQAPELRYAYAGNYTAVQEVRTENDVISASGRVDISDFAIGNPRQPMFLEKLVRLSNNVQVDQKAKDLIVRDFGLDMQSSKALTLAATGAIRDYASQRKFDNVRVVLGYDAAKAVDLIRPMLSPESRQQLDGVKIAGVVRGREYLISGSYPVVDAASSAASQRDPLAYVRMIGSLSLDRLEYQGLVAERIDLPVMMSDGVVRVVHADKPQAEQYPAPIRVNGGKLDIGGLELALAGGSPRVSLPRPNHKLLENVTINKEMVAEYLGIINPLFTGTQEARGVLNATVNELSQLPIDRTLVQPQGRSSGVGRFTFSISELRLRAPFLNALAQQLQMKANPDGTLPGSIRDAVVVLTDGTIRSDFGLDLGGQVIGFRDSVVRLSDREIVSMTMAVPKGMIPVREVREQKLIRDVISVPVTGSVTRPQFDIVQAALRSAAIPQRLPDLLELFEDEDEKKDDGKQPPQQPRQRRAPRRAPTTAPSEPPPGTIGRPRR